MFNFITVIFKTVKLSNLDFNLVLNLILLYYIFNKSFYKYLKNFIIFLFNIFL